MLVACCAALATCAIVRAEEAAPTVESVESHLESTRETGPELVQPAQLNADAPVGSAGAIYSPFAAVDASGPASRSSAEVRADSSKDSDTITTLIAVAVCSAGLGYLLVAVWNRV